MKKQFLLFLLLVCLSLTSSISAQVVNDDLCNAQTITLNEGCSTPNIILEGSTRQPNEPDRQCTQEGSILDSIIQHSVWFKFVAPANEIVIQATTDTATFNDDYQLNLFSLDNDCSDLMNLQYITCDAPSHRLLQSPRIVTTLMEGSTYYLQVAARKWDFDTVAYLGPGCLTIDEVIVPANDEPCNAIALDLDASPKVFSNQGATAQVNESIISPPASSSPVGFGSDGWSLGETDINHSVWFSFTTPDDPSNVTVDLLSSLQLGGNMNAKLAIYEVGDCNDFNTFNLVGASDNGFTTQLGGFLVQVFPQNILQCLAANTTYYILVDGARTFFGDTPTRNEGNFSISVQLDGISASAATISSTDTLQDCTDDNIINTIEVSLEGGNGTQYEWVVTDTNLNILDLPGAPPFNFEGQDSGVVFIWHINYDDIVGLEVDSNATNLTGCFGLSNSIEVRLLTGEACQLGPGVNTFETTWPEAEISLSPNPASDWLNISISGIEERDVNLSVQDIMGRELLETTLQGQSQNLDVSTLPAGSYFLIFSNSFKMTTRQFIKTNTN